MSDKMIRLLFNMNPNCYNSLIKQYIIWEHISLVVICIIFNVLLLLHIGVRWKWR